MNFQETGTKIPISSQELINYVHTELESYDKKVVLTKGPSFPNPYTDSIIYKTPEGKTIKVPGEIQKEAINLWVL